MRARVLATSASVAATWSAGLGEATAEAATATRGLGLDAAEGDAVLTGVGIGVLMLRVSVAAAPGTGVASGPSSVEQPAASATSSAAATDLAQVIAQFLGPTGMPQLAKRLGLDLTDALSCNAELTTDFLKRTLTTVVEPESQSDNAALAL